MVATEKVVARIEKKRKGKQAGEKKGAEAKSNGKSH